MHTFGVNQIAPISEKPLKRNSSSLLQSRMLLTSSLARVPTLPLQVQIHTEKYTFAWVDEILLTLHIVCFIWKGLTAQNITV